MEKKCKIANISEQIVESYKLEAGVNHIDSENLPSKGSIANICQDLLQLLFPGYLDSITINREELYITTHARVASLVKRLLSETQKAIYSIKNNQAQKINHNDAENYLDIVCKFMVCIPEIRSILKTDIQAAYEGDPAAKSFDEIILAYPCIEAIAIQRLAHVLYKEKVPLIPRMMTEWTHSITGIDIHPGAKIGKYFFIDHGTGVVIGETCEIGKHVKLYHGVTLGARSFEFDKDGKIVKGRKRHPQVEDNVTIYPNATILGGKTVIGSGSTIGANVFIMESVSSNTLIAKDSKSDGYRLLVKK